MNHEELIHLRDKYMLASLTGVLANPISNRLDSKAAALMAQDVTDEVLRLRKQYYEGLDQLKEIK